MSDGLDADELGVQLRVGPVLLELTQIGKVCHTRCAIYCSTGIGAGDVTPEATRKVIDRELPGLAETMRAASARQTPNALLSRAVAGVRGATLIVNVPGSPKAATENLEAILPALPHAVKMLRNETAHPENDKQRLTTLNTESTADLPVEVG